MTSHRSLTPTAQPIETQNSKIENPAVAHAAFAILEKLDSGRRRPPPSIARVFRLYFIEGLSASQVARECRCSKPAVIRRLNFIRHKTGLPTARLRVQYPCPATPSDLPDAPIGKTPNRSNLLYAGADDEDSSFPE